METATVAGKTVTHIRLSGGPVLTWEDLSLRADDLLYDPGKALYAEATGSVILKRGDEEMRGDSFIVNGEQGLITIRNGSIFSPPLFIQAAAITKSPSEIRATDARVELGGNDGRGEIRLCAGEVRVTPDKGGRPGVQHLALRNASVYLFNARLITLRRAAFTLLPQSKDEGANTPRLPPVVARTSRISGFLAGVSLPFVLGTNTTSRVDVDMSTRRGLQEGVLLRHTLIAAQSGGIPHSKVDAVAPGGVDPSVANLSPLRQILKARPQPPPPDPILDYTNILNNTSTVIRPTRVAQRDLHLELNVTDNREYGFQRQGPLLLSRLPEAIVSATVPLNGPLSSMSDSEAKRALHQLRFFITGQQSFGHYDEERIQEGNQHVRGGRIGIITGIAMQPLLIGQNLLAQAQTTYRSFSYASDRHYDYVESSLNATYIFGYRTSIGGAYIARDVGGSTPFLWDQVDTQSEGQIRGQIALGRNARYTLAALGRYDLSQHRFFDYEFTLATRGRNIEPRVSYSRLNREISFGLTLVGISM